MERVRGHGEGPRDELGVVHEPLGASLGLAGAVIVEGVLDVDELDVVSRASSGCLDSTLKPVIEFAAESVEEVGLVAVDSGDSETPR